MGSVEKNAAQISALLSCPCGPEKSCSSVGLSSPTVNKESGLEDHLGLFQHSGSRIVL